MSQGECENVQIITGFLEERLQLKGAKDQSRTGRINSGKREKRDKTGQSVKPCTWSPQLLLSYQLFFRNISCVHSLYSVHV